MDMSKLKEQRRIVYIQAQNKNYNIEITVYPHIKPPDYFKNRSENLKGIIATTKANGVILR